MPTQPNPIAVAAIAAKTPVGSPLNTEGWSRVPLALREAAQFSARIESLRFLQAVQNRIETSINAARREGMGKDGGPGAYQTREKFVAELQKIAREEGLDPRNFGAPEKMGGLQDPTSVRRLNLIHDIQTENVQEFAKWKMDQDPDVLSAYPAQEFIRVSARKHKRTDWQERWRKAGGKLFKGRMVALKTDPVWKRLSRFGKPWPPFDFGSGMGLRDISRREAVSLGVLKKGAEVKPIEADFTDKMEAGVKDLGPKMQSALGRSFGDQVVIEEGVAKWQGNVIGDLYEKALSERELQREIDLGVTTPAALDRMRAAGIEDLTDYSMKLRADEMRKVDKKHGAAETDPSQFPITRLDWEMVPHVWRDPDAVTRQGPDRFILEKQFQGNLYVADWIANRESRDVRLRSLYKKKVPGA